MAESELDALQEAFGDDELTPDAITVLRNMIAMLMGRADITPADLQTLRDQVTMLEERADITPTDLQALRDQIAMLEGRADITPADLQTLRDQVTMLEERADITPTDLQALRDRIAMLEGRADITPADLQTLRDQVTMLEERADITPTDLQALRDQIAMLEGRADITPTDLQALRDQIAMLEGRTDTTPADLQALRDQIAMLEGRADITPEELQALRDEIEASARQAQQEKVIGISLPVGLLRSAAAPVHAANPEDTLAALLPDAQNRFAPLSSSMRRSFSDPQRSDLVDDAYVKAISSDGNNGFHVTYVVNGEERMVHFEDADYDSEDDAFSKATGSIEQQFSARTDAFDGPDRNRGSSRYDYFDAALLWFNSPGSRVFATYGARTEDASLPAGTADYVGQMESYSHDRNSPDNALRIRVRGDLELNADFDASTLKGRIDGIRVRAADEDEYRTLPDTTRLAIDDGRIIEGQFAAALTGMDSNPNAPLDDTVRGYVGGVLGEFYGPSAEEVGGVLNAESEAHDRVVHGWFGGKQFALDPRIPAGNLSIFSALVDWDENMETMRPSDTQVTAVESDGAAGLRMTYSVGGTEHTVHLSASDFDEGDGWYFRSDQGRWYYLWNMDGSLTDDDEEFSYFNVNAWYESNDSWPPADVTRGFIIYGNPTETLPAAGTAEYAGRIYAEARPSDGSYGPRTRVRSDSLALTADFGQSTLGGTIDDIEIRGPDDSGYEDASGQFTIQNGSITNGRIAADLSGSQDVADYDVDMNGRFFGPDAAEVGGALTGTNTADGTVVQGWFGAAKE